MPARSLNSQFADSPDSGLPLATPSAVAADSSLSRQATVQAAQGTSQSVLDALADAETLRLVAADHFASAVASGEMYATRYRDYHAYGATGIFGLRMSDGSSVLDSATPEHAAEIMFLAARGDGAASFRAVPDLRRCTTHEPCLLDEGTFCRHCGVRLNAYGPREHQTLCLCGHFVAGRAVLVADDCPEHGSRPCRIADPALCEHCRRAIAAHAAFRACPALREPKS